MVPMFQPQITNNRGSSCSLTSTLIRVSEAFSYTRLAPKFRTRSRFASSRRSSTTYHSSSDCPAASTRAKRGKEIARGWHSLEITRRSTPTQSRLHPMHMWKRRQIRPCRLESMISSSLESKSYKLLGNFSFQRYRIRKQRHPCQTEDSRSF